MKRIVLIYGLLLCLALSVAAQEKVVKLKIVETSDVHGNYYPYNFGSSSNLVVISFLFQLSSSFLILLKVVDMFAF